MIRLTIENNTFREEVVSIFSIRLWSLMRCNKSPVILLSKKAIGKFINLIKKSEIKEMLMRELRCSRIQLRITSSAVLPKNRKSWVNKIK